ncbi:putative GDSL esterase/lipase-like [Capsicum annuum]|nr:putative GDSL esterase/lipase-like [Capsicum annuum]
MAIEDDHGLHGLDHQNSEFMSPQINDEDPLKQVNHEDDPLSSLRPKSTSGRSSSDSDEDGRSKRARSSPESNSEERELLGLTLNKTPSFVNLIETQLSEGKSSSSSSSPCPPRKVGRPPTRKNANKSKTDDFAISSEKLKASNFPARKLQVGDWERISKHEGDLIAKYYYAKRKLVWEILDGPLKNKIEIQWSDIIAIRAITPKGDHPGVLEIELNEPPILYRETNPQPRKHTLWQQSADFTGGQVGIHRRHCVTFPPGILDKHYEKLLGFDSRLNELSKKPYPSILCPYFPSYNPHEVSDFPFDSVYGSPLFPKKLNNPFYFSPALLPNRRLPNKSAMAAIPLRQFSSSFPISGERRSNFANINQRRALWGGQGSNNSLMNVTMGNQTNGMLLDQGSNNSLMTVALGNQTSGMLGGQGSDNSLMNVALGNQTSGMLLDQGSDNSLMTVVMECRQTIEMLCNQGSSNNLMNVALGNQTSGMLGDQGSNNNLMNAAMENQTIGMLRDQGSNNSLMNVAMGNQTSGMLHSSSTTPQADWVVPTQDDHQQNNSLPNNEFISVLDFMTNHLLNENNQVASSSNENLDSMYPLLEHQGNESLVAASDMHDLYSSYQTVSNYAENVVPDYGMTYAEPLTWMYPEETSEILGLGQTMESLLADPYYQTLDANQGIRKSGNVISKRTELSFYINNIVSNDHKQIEVSGSSLGYGENPIRSATPEWALQCAIRISRVWRSKATRMSMHLKPSSMFSLTVNQHASYGKLLDILWVSNTKANHAGITMTLKLAMAAHFAVKWLKARGYKSCVVEMDSLLIVNMMQNRASHNMNLRPIVEDTTRLIVSNEITFSHCYREANMVSDFLAKLAASSGESVLYTDFGQLPAGAKGAYFLDKSQLPNLRIRYDKANFFVR